MIECGKIQVRILLIDFSWFVHSGEVIIFLMFGIWIRFDWLFSRWLTWVWCLPRLSEEPTMEKVSVTSLRMFPTDQNQDLFLRMFLRMFSTDQILDFEFISDHISENVPYWSDFGFELISDQIFENALNWSDVGFISENVSNWSFETSLLDLQTFIR